MKSCLGTSKGYPVHRRERAVRVNRGARAGHQPDWAAIIEVPGWLGIGTAQPLELPAVIAWVDQPSQDALIPPRD